MDPSHHSAVTVSEATPNILLMTLDLPGKGANILSAQMFDELEAAITPFLNRDDIEGLILISAKPKIFVAGANLNEIQEGLDWPDERIFQFCERGRHVMSLFHTAPFTTVAAIHGACVGGGFELTLWCDYRIASDDRRTMIGLPEVNLGLIPGWAGTVRVARLADLETQLDLVTSAKLLDGTKAQQSGLVDAVVSEEQLLAEAKKLIASTPRADVAKRREWSDQPLTDVPREALTRQYTEKISQPGNPIYPVAPLIALEHMLRAAELPLPEACDSESRAFAAAWGSPASYGLLHNFFLTDYAKKLPAKHLGELKPRAVQRVGVIGQGVMGEAITKLNLKASLAVNAVETNVDKLNAVLEQIPASDRFAAFSQLSDLPEVDLVIEAIPELPQRKRQLLADLEQHVAPDTVIASNTSAIPIRELADALQKPDRFCGLHFCHPQLMALVEIIVTESTPDETLATMVGYVKSLRKLAIVVKDSPGFAVNRLLASLFRAAIDLVLSGVDFLQVDASLRSFGFRAGPFEIMDVIGIDTCVLAGRSMWDAGLESVDQSPLLPRMMKLGRMGRKSLHGFYRYESKDGEAIPCEDAKETVAQYQSGAPQVLAEEEIAERILSAMASEAQKMLAEGVVADARDLDLASIHGFGFPAHEGGILFWAQRQK